MFNCEAGMLLSGDFDPFSFILIGGPGPCSVKNAPNKLLNKQEHSYTHHHKCTEIMSHDIVQLRFEIFHYYSTIANKVL